MIGERGDSRSEEMRRGYEQDDWVELTLFLFSLKTEQCV